MTAATTVSLNERLRTCAQLRQLNTNEIGYHWCPPHDSLQQVQAYHLTFSQEQTT